MNELRLDYQHSRSFPLGGAILLAIALGGLMLAGEYYLELNGMAADWEARLASHGRDMSRQHAGSSPSRPSADMALEVQHANEVLRQIGLPWEGLFRAVESSGSREVVLLALEPDMEKRVLKIGGEAKNIPAMLGYITRLGEQDMFESVYLLSHQVQLKSQDKPVRFSLVAAMKEEP